MKTQKIFWFFSSTGEWRFVFGCLILKQMLPRVLFGLITMIRIEKSMKNLGLLCQHDAKRVVSSKNFLWWIIALNVYL